MTPAATIFILTCLCMLSTVLCENGTTTAKSTIWRFRRVRNEINTSAIIATKVVDTLTSCLFFCYTRPQNDVVSLYYINAAETCHCHSVYDVAPDDDSTDSILYGIPFDAQEPCRSMQISASEAMKDCLEFYETAGYIWDGVYPIVGWDGSTTSVCCDMTNGGWTVVQQRFDGSVDFYRGWSDYRLGFGEAPGEYWLGLENLHYLTGLDSELAVFVEAFPGVSPPSAYAQYDHVYIGDSESLYTLNISGYHNGTCGDSLAWGNGMHFSTFDMDNDVSLKHCAANFQGAWWYKGCHESHLNGHYFKSGEYDASRSSHYASGIHWQSCWNFAYSQMSTLMKLRRTK